MIFHFLFGFTAPFTLLYDLMGTPWESYHENKLRKTEVGGSRGGRL